MNIKNSSDSEDNLEIKKRVVKKIKGKVGRQKNQKFKNKTQSIKKRRKKKPIKSESNSVSDKNYQKHDNAIKQFLYSAAEEESEHEHDESEKDDNLNELIHKERT